MKPAPLPDKAGEEDDPRGWPDGPLVPVEGGEVVVLLDADEAEPAGPVVCVEVFVTCVIEIEFGA